MAAVLPPTMPRPLRPSATTTSTILALPPARYACSRTPTAATEAYPSHATPTSLSLSLSLSLSTTASSTTTTTCTPSSRPPTTTFETLPVEIINNILSYLTHPRSRLPGLTEAQSDHDLPRHVRLDVKNREDLTTPPDTDRWAADLFSWPTLRHPFNVLALTSRRCNRLVESYASHLVRTCNMFNLPFDLLDKFGSHCVYPDMSGIVYRRLWLQHAPRKCIYCAATLDCYPFLRVSRIIAACQDCFYRQTLTVDEVERQYHISIPTILESPDIRGARSGSPCTWVLRIDVEAMALQLYGTRAFHNAHLEQFGKPCSICAITRFTPPYAAAANRVSKRTSPRGVRRVASLRKSTRKVARYG